MDRERKALVENPSIRICVDFRERDSGVVKALQQKPRIALHERALRMGDYVINDFITVERKTCRDFCLSIIDGRLFRQVSRMKKEAARPVLVIEGTDVLDSGVSIDPHCVRGALAPIAVCWHLPAVFCRDAEETAEFLETAGRQDLIFEKEIWIRHGQKPKTHRKRKLFILQGLPDIGPKRARSLLEHFGSVEKVISASERELQDVPFVGTSTARAIRSIVEED